MFNYYFYRIYTFYKSKDDIPLARGIFYVTLLQIFLIGSIIIVFNSFAHGLISDKNIDKGIIRISGIILIIALCVFNYIRYSKKERIDKLREKYEGRKMNKYFKLWMLFLLMPTLLSLAILFVVVKNKFF